MNELNENTLTAYLGPQFQLKLMWQLLVEPEFAEKTIPNLAIEYFDDPNLKRLFIIITEYFKEYDKVPNLQNQSIQQAINKYKTPNNLIEEETLFGVLKRVELWNERIINKQMLHDGEIVQKATNSFIKQQEYRKLAEGIIDKVKSGAIRNKHELFSIEDKFQKITHIGEEEDDCEEVTEGIDKALRKEFRKTIPTGVEVIDALTGGGLGKGEIGVVLTPSGVGKALPNSHKVLTPNGWVENGTLKVNDYVFGSDGKSQKILGVYSQGKRKIYKITFSDQTTSYCDLEHLWAVNSFKQRNQKTNIDGKTLSIPDHTFQILKTSEMLEDFKLKNGLNYMLPNVSPVQFNKTEVKIDPYVMGVFLGDELGLYGTDSSTKFIPEVYLHNCVEYREKLLQGLIDSDGGVGKNSAIIYSTVSKKLSENVRELVLSLGGTCRVNEKFKTYTNSNNIKVSGKLNYTLTISFPNNGIISCTLPAKLDRVVIRDKYEYNKFIKNIEYSHEEDATCIYVENDDHLYVIDDYILTHNTTLLTKIANTAYEQEYNVAQVIFEDTKDQIKRKHYAIWSGIPLSKIDDDIENEKVKERVHAKVETLKGKGRLVIKRFSQEDTTIKDVKNWMLSHQKKWGFKFDILVLDYLDCLESHKKTPDRNEAELAIIKGFETLASDFDIPSWTAIQSNRSGFDAEFVEAHQSGGSIKRIQKAHFFMSVAKTPEQKEASLANIRIIKARFAQDGQTFTDCVFNNDTMEIRIEDDRYKSVKMYKGQKHHDEVDISKIESTANKFHVAVSESFSKINDETINEVPTIRDVILEDMAKKFAEQNNKPLTQVTETPLIEEQTESRISDDAVSDAEIVNMHFSTNRTDLSSREVNELVDFVTETVREAELLEFYSDNNTDNILDLNVNEGVSEGVLDWTGETFTREEVESLPEVTINDVPSVVNIPVDNRIYEIKEAVKSPSMENNRSILEVEKRLLNPDEIIFENRSVHEMLKKERKNQQVMKSG